MSTPQTVVITRLSALGDILLTLPAIDALAKAWPHARLVYVTHRVFAPLLHKQPNIHHVLAFEPDWGLWDLRAALKPWAPFALCDFHGKWRGRILRLLHPKCRTVGWHKRDVGQTLRMRVGDGRYAPRMLIAQRYHQAVERLVGRLLEPEPLQYRVSVQDTARIAKLVQAHNPSGQKLIGISPGAQWQTKRWPEKRFVALARKLGAKGYTILWLGSPKEAPEIREMAACVPGSIDFVAQSPLRDLGAVIAQCALFIGNDSGPMHMARALRVPTLAFFGSTTPYHFDQGTHGMMFAKRDCAPCSFHGRAYCPRGHMACLTDLRVDAAFEHAEKLLMQQRPLQVWG